VRGRSFSFVRVVLGPRHSGTGVVLRIEGMTLFLLLLLRRQECFRAPCRSMRLRIDLGTSWFVMMLVW
jgi:hypothetical protein